MVYTAWQRPRVKMEASHLRRPREPPHGLTQSASWAVRLAKSAARTWFFWMDWIVVWSSGMSM